jgi:prepilin-type processing-associated H-X9-DG protein
LYSTSCVSAAAGSSAFLLNDIDACYAATRANDSGCRHGWGSFHTGGINFVFCDGSVHSISISIDTTLLAEMAVSISKYADGAGPGRRMTGAAARSRSSAINSTRTPSSRATFLPKGRRTPVLI